MSCARLHRGLAATALAGALLATGTAAQADTTKFLDLSASLGYSNNPNNQVGSQSSLFGRLSASGGLQWSREHGSTSVNGYIENSTYVKGGYGSKQIFSLGAQSSEQVSENVSLFGNVGFSGDFGGQLSNRLYTVPSQPVPVDPTNPLPPPNADPDLFGLNGRQYRAEASLGASIRAGTRGTVSLTGGVQHSFFTGAQKEADYTAYTGSAGYSQQVSSRTSAGATVFLQHQDFRHGDWSNTINPTLNISTQLSETMSASAGIGVIVLQQESLGEKDHSVSPSFSGSLCGDWGKVSRLCGHVSRDAQTALSSGFIDGRRQASINTSIGVDYFRRLGAEGTFQAGLSGVHYDSPSNFDDGNKLKTTYISGVVGYDRQIGSRIYAGVNVGARKLFESGTDPKPDYNASVYIRYRLGDLL